jgi:hypothetical protein
MEQQSQITSWPLVRAAQRADGLRERSALYNSWLPRIRRILSALGVPAQQTDDVIQSFFLDLEERNDLVRLDPSRGRVRSWLNCCVPRHFFRIRKAEAALRRGVGVRFVELEDAQPADDLDPEQLEGERQAYEMLQRSENRLRADYEARGRLDVFLELFGALHGPDGERDSHHAEKLGWTEENVRQERCQMRRQFSDYAVSYLLSQGISRAEIRKRLERLDAAVRRLRPKGPR